MAQHPLNIGTEARPLYSQSVNKSGRIGVCELARPVRPPHCREWLALRFLWGRDRWNRRLHNTCPFMNKVSGTFRRRFTLSITLRENERPCQHEIRPAE